MSRPASDPRADAARVDAEIRRLAAKVPENAPSARRQAAAAADAVSAALAADPTLAERNQRDLDVLGELLRRLTPLARSAAAELERRRLDAAGADHAHLGRTSTVAPEELESVSARCAVIAGRVTAAVLPDWDTPRRIRELSASRLPGERELAIIAGQLRTAVAAALELPHPDPEAVRLAALADLITSQTGPEAHELSRDALKDHLAGRDGNPDFRLSAQGVYDVMAALDQRGENVTLDTLSGDHAVVRCLNRSAVEGRLYCVAINARR